MSMQRGLGNRAPSFFKPIKHETAKVETMRVKLNIDYLVALDGIRLTSFQAGQEADFPVSIAQALLEDGRASLPAAAKMELGSPEDKMLDGPGANKAGARKGGRRK